MKVRSKIILTLLVLVSALALATEQFFANYPVPPETENSLFYIQRSKNTNAIVYDANVNSEGTLNPEEPIKIYWIRYATDGTKEPLSFIQQKYAYGLTAKPYPGKPGQYVLTFNAYNKKQLYLLKNSNNKHYSAYTLINGHYAQLKKIYIKVSGGSFWFPNIDYIDIIGKDIATQKPINERFKPL